MRRFESIVMSETEPVTPGTLWMRLKKNSIKGNNDEKLPVAGMSIWWFGEKGWQPLVDLDTRYTVTNINNYEPATKPLDSEVTNKPEIGMVDTVVTYNIYNGSRGLGSNSNFVNETGLKKHVDILKSEIDSLTNRVTVLEKTVNRHENELDVLKEFMFTGFPETINDINTNITALTTKCNENASEIANIKNQLNP